MSWLLLVAGAYLLSFVVFVLLCATAPLMEEE